MKTKKPQNIFTIIGIVLIIISIILFFYGKNYYAVKDINQAIENSFGPTLKGKGFDVTIKYSLKGYKAYLTLNNEDNLFEYSSWCGCVGTYFLTSFKQEHPDIDKQISEYHFDFLERYKSSYGYSSDYSTAYTAQYINDQNEASIYQIKLILKEGQGNSEDEAKTYLEYLKEWSIREYRPYAYPYSYMTLNGEHYTVQVNDDNSYNIKPNSEDDLERNPDSSLMWYMDEFSSQFFTVSNVNKQIASNDMGNSIEINFRYTNNFKSSSQYALIEFYIYNERGEVIGTTGIFTPYLEPNESKDLVVSEIYKDEMPSYFKIAYIKYIKKSSQEEVRYIVYE